MRCLLICKICKNRVCDIWYLVEHICCLGLKDLARSWVQDTCVKICSILLRCYWSITTMMLPIILYKFVICFPLRIIMELLVTLISPSALENLHPWAFKALNERRFFLRSRICRMFVRIRTCPSNCSSPRGGWISDVLIKWQIMWN